MPSREQHLDQAKRNEGFARHLLEFPWSPDCSDWALISLFYAAVHLVDAYLATRNYHPETHVLRDGYASRLTSLQPVYNHYRILRFRSEEARYSCRKSPYTVQFAELKRVNNFDPVKAHIRSLLG